MIPNVSPKIGNNSNFLNQVFNTFINNKYSTHSRFTIETLEIYDILLQLLEKNNLKPLINEIKYRVTDGETLNDVFIDIIESNNYIPLEIETYLTALYDIENHNWLEKFS